MLRLYGVGFVVRGVGGGFIFQVGDSIVKPPKLFRFGYFELITSIYA